MGFSSLCLIFVSMSILSKFVLFHLVVANSLQSNTTTCHDDEISALLHFKQSFVIDKSVSEYKGAYPKMASWKFAENQTSNCCTWDGVECDEKTGHVVGLDLSSSCLYGSINSNNSLFRLAHLESLNLADNHFNDSQVPTSIRNCPRLRYLNLSFSAFSGLVPCEIAQLSKLSSLDLSKNQITFSNEELLRSLAQNITGLETLDLSFNNISSTIPKTMANLSFLTSFLLDDCSMFGEFPGKIFNLQNLKFLSLSNNHDLTGYFPEFNESISPLMSLKLAFTPFFVNLSSLIEKFDSLKELDVRACDISEGPLPSSLGNLRHLIYLDLSSNKFNGEIPSSLGNLFQLTHLSLSDNNFNGQIPSSFGNFIQLTSLSLSGNNFHGKFPSSLGNLTQLTFLSLSSNNFHGQIPSSLGNLTQLTNLSLFDNNFHGQIPSSLGNLTQLTTLLLFGNNFHGQILSFLGNLTQLTSLVLYGNNFHGQIPSSLGNHIQLTGLSLSDNNFHGQIPSSLRNLNQLIYLSLSDNNFDGQIPSFLGNLIQLTYLSLSGNNFQGQIPSSLGNLIQLTYLSLSSNNFHGQIPSSFENLIQLTTLSLSSNNFQGSIPRSLFNLINLSSLHLNDNNLSGIVEFHMFHKLQKLTSLDLCRNKLEVLIESRFTNNATTLPKFEFLLLSWCNIGEFPNFLRSQETLRSLDLSGNKFQGQVPKWILNTSTQTLQEMNISHNFLSGFEQSPAVLPWVHLKYLDISYNKLGGSLLMPSPNIVYYIFSNNKLTGAVSSLICNLTSLQFLDLSHNKLIGMLPQCLGNFSDHLEYLNLGNNSFRGILPETYTNRSNLRMIDVSHNQLQGKLPRSFANCSKLEFLVLSNNEFNHVFPFWLGKLPNLRVLAMRHNRFHGGIGKPKLNLHFPELLILDLSFNNFTGEFPSEFIFSGHAMRGDISRPYTKDTDKDNFTVLLDDGYYFRCSITITNKGIEINYPKIQDDLAVVNISSNRFEGKIPEFIGNLKRIRSLNISNNNLTGCIPSSLGNLTLLESLDLSQNKLSGPIPQQLKKLSFLEKLNVSHNNLTGHIPSGTQFNTFDITSYEGNPGLCGDPLQKKCENPEGTQLPPSTKEENDLGSEIEWDWKFVLAGLGSGLVVGLVLANVAITRWSERFIEIVSVLSRIVKRMRRPRS